MNGRVGISLKAVDDWLDGERDGHDVPQEDMPTLRLNARLIDHDLPRPPMLPEAALCPPPTAETGTMPVVVMEREGSDDQDRQDATRTTAELQIAAAAAAR
jgi:hypothetical protein